MKETDINLRIFVTSCELRLPSNLIGKNDRALHAIMIDDDDNDDDDDDDATK